MVVECNAVNFKVEGTAAAGQLPREIASAVEESRCFPVAGWTPELEQQLCLGVQPSHRLGQHSRPRRRKVVGGPTLDLDPVDAAAQEQTSGTREIVASLGRHRFLVVTGGQPEAHRELGAI